MFQESVYTDEQRLIADTVIQLSKQYDDNYFLKTTKQDIYPTDFWQEICAAGFLGLLVAERYGGSLMTTPDLLVFLHNMAKGGLVSYQLCNQIICSDIVGRLGTVKQQEVFLPNIVKGEFWSYANLEATEGNSLFDIATTARQQADKYVLNGSKSYAVCAQMASHLVLAARTEEYNPDFPEQGVSLFVVDAKTVGINYSVKHLNVRVTEAREEMAATGDMFVNVQLDNVQVPLTGLIGGQGQAADAIKRIASLQLLLTATMAIGWGDRLIDKTAAYASERIIFKDSLASYQAVQHPLVKAKTDVEMAKLLAERAGELFSATDDHDTLLTYCGVAKRNATEAVFAACDIATQTHGGAGYDRDTGIISIWPLILLSRITPLNNSVILKNFAEDVLDMPCGDGNTRSKQVLSWESRDQRDVDFIAVAKSAIAKVSEDASLDSIMALMGRILGGDLVAYKDLVLSETQGGLPVKLDVFRALAVYGGADPTAGGGMAKSMLKRRPAKYGLSAMAMAAVSSGKDGAALAMNEYVPKMMEGKLFCYCITEPNAGTNTHNVSTIAVDKGDHYVLNGQKTFISAADTAYFMAVVARVEIDGKKGSVGTFVLEASIAGISMTELDIAALGDPQFTVHFDDVILPKSALVGTKSAAGGKGKENSNKGASKGISEGVFYTLNLERIMVALGAMKVGEESLERALIKAREPAVFGPPAGASDDIKQRLARLKLDLELTNLALKKATHAFDNNAPGKQVGMYANMAKYVSTMFADEVGNLALQLYGVAGLDKDIDDIGALCQLGRVLRTVPINNEMVLNFLAENLMGLPKSYRV
ncbi:MAG: acyl-CoA dehydrogenase family protein [Pseudomonadales bacterium]|nr:acyl-CoA dehydrogenase family protein [Pseudomonadales bacterium]